MIRQAFNSKQSLAIVVVVYAVCLVGIPLMVKLRTKNRRLFLDSCVWKIPGARETLACLQGGNYFVGGTRLGPVLEWYKRTRNPNYTVSSPEYDQDPDRFDTVLTGWGVAHFSMYYILGFLAPGRWKLFLVVGTLFELGEYLLYDAHAYLDVVWNVVGMLCGMAARSIAEGLSGGNKR